MNKPFLPTKNELKMRVVRRLRKHGFSIVFPIRRSTHYLSDIPELLVLIGHSTYVGMAFHADRVTNQERYNDIGLSERLKRIQSGNIAFIVRSEDEAMSIVQSLNKAINAQHPSWR